MNDFEALERGFANFKKLFKQESLVKQRAISIFGMLDSSLSPARKTHKFFAASKDVGMYYEDISTKTLIEYGRESPAAILEIEKQIARMLDDLKKNPAP